MVPGFIKSLAGKAGAYAHVGGKAQDLGVRALDVDTKGKLITALGKAGLKVLTEQVNGSKSKYNVAVSSANVLHVYID